MSGAKGPSFAVLGDERTETRKYIAHSYRSEVGRSRVEIECPYCGRYVTAYLWSLAGGGKRCPCGALFGSGNAYHWVDPYPTTPSPSRPETKP